MQFWTAAIDLAYAGLCVYLAMYLHKLQTSGCQCAIEDDNATRKYVICYLIGRALLALLSALPTVAPGVRAALAALLLPADLLASVFALQIINKLKKKKCTCSEGNGRDILEIVAVVDIAIIVFLCLMFAQAAFVAASAVKIGRKVRR